MKNRNLMHAGGLRVPLAMVCVLNELIQAGGTFYDTSRRVGGH